jgi:hypothetical protein
MSAISRITASMAAITVTGVIAIIAVIPTTCDYTNLFIRYSSISRDLITLSVWFISLASFAYVFSMLTDRSSTSITTNNFNWKQWTIVTVVVCFVLFAFYATGLGITSNLDALRSFPVSTGELTDSRLCVKG